MKRTLWSLAALLVLALLLFGVAVSRLDSEALGAAVIEQIRLASGIEVQAERSTLHPLRGLTLEGVEAMVEAPSGRVDADIEHLTIRHRLLPLLWGEVIMDEVRLTRPVIELASKPAKRRRAGNERRPRRAGAAEEAPGRADEKPSAQSRTDSSAGVRLSIETLHVEDGTLVTRTRDRDADNFRAARLDLQLKGLKLDPQVDNPTLAASGTGRFTTGQIEYGDFKAEESSGRLELAEGTARVGDLGVRALHGELSIPQLEAWIDRDPPQYELSAAGRLDLNGILGVAEGGRFGPLGLDLAARGKGPELRTMLGKGSLTLEAGSLPGFPAMVQIEELLGRALLTGREYETATIEYELRANQLILAPFELVADGGNVGGSGVVDLGGSLDLDLYVRVPGETLDIGVVDDARLAELEDEQGMVKIPFTLSGPFEDPGIGMEWQGIQELIGGVGRSWAERALQEAAEKAREWLQNQSSDPESDQD